MIAFLEGKIISKKERFIILDVNGVGYKVFVSRRTFSKLPKTGEKLKIFCFLDVRENSLTLYGFLKEEELEFFEILEKIRGVGPKGALEISSLGSLKEIKEKILSQDGKIFEKIPSIGKKKAMAIILELSGKIKDVSFKKEKKSDEAEEALVSLGFSRQKAKEALKKVPNNVKNTEERVKYALKFLGK